LERSALILRSSANAASVNIRRPLQEFDTESARTAFHGLTSHESRLVNLWRRLEITDTYRLDVYM